MGSRSARSLYMLKLEFVEGEELRREETIVDVGVSVSADGLALGCETESS